MAVIILTGSGKTADIREILFRGRSWTWSEDKHALVAEVWVKTKLEAPGGEFCEQTMGTLLSKGDRTLIMKLLQFAVDQEYPHHKTVPYQPPVHPMSKSVLAVDHLAQEIKKTVEDMSTFKKALVKSVVLPPEFIGMDMAGGEDKTVTWPGKVNWSGNKGSGK